MKIVYNMISSVYTKKVLDRRKENEPEKQENFNRNIDKFLVGGVDCRNGNRLLGIPKEERWRLVYSGGGSDI